MKTGNTPTSISNQNSEFGQYEANYDSAKEKDKLSSAKDSVAEFGKNISERLIPIKDNAVTFSNDVGAWVKRYPVASAGIALSAGVFIGRALASTARSSVSKRNI